MSRLPESKWAKPAKAEPAMPEATKAELTKADLANAEFAMSELTISELEPEFRDQHRIDLLTSLKTALKVISVDKVTSVLWAHLWLSDIDMLEDLVRSNMRQIKSLLVHAERPAAVVKKCEFINFHTFSWCRFANVMQGTKDNVQHLLQTNHLHQLPYNWHLHRIL
jgi:hypothetical protein